MCDVVPLKGLNRALVTQGLKVAARGANPGLAALAAAARLRGAASAEQFGFVLGPRVNAGGRTGCSRLAADLLLSDEPDEIACWSRGWSGSIRSAATVESRVLAAAEASARTGARGRCAAAAASRARAGRRAWSASSLRAWSSAITARPW